MELTEAQLYDLGNRSCDHRGLEQAIISLRKAVVRANKRIDLLSKKVRKLESQNAKQAPKDR